MRSLAKELTLPVIFGAVIGFLASETTDKYLLERDLRNNTKAVDIDRDSLPDLVIGNRIFLANQTDRGIE